MKDSTQFRERFKRWKEGEQVYENGLALPSYEDGKDSEYPALGAVVGQIVDEYVRRKLPAPKLDKKEVINFLYGVENPQMKNINTRLNIVKAFDDGWTPTIGPGVANTSNAPKEWFNGKWHSKYAVDNYAYQHLSHDDEVIRNAYNTRFGTKQYPNPADTLSMWPRLYMAQNRYQLGNLGGSNKGRDAILDAVSTGNVQNIINTLSRYGMNGDTDRMRRVQKSYPAKYIKPANLRIK